MALMKLLKHKTEPELPYRRELAVFEARPGEGLSTAQAKERMDAGWGNAPIEPPGKTVGEIIRSNIFTYFNMLFFLLAACVIAVGAVKEIMFLGVVIANIAIGIVQELRSKKRSTSSPSSPRRRAPWCATAASGRYPRPRWCATTWLFSPPGARFSRTPW